MIIKACTKSHGSEQRKGVPDCTWKRHGVTDHKKKMFEVDPKRGVGVDLVDKGLPGKI